MVCLFILRPPPAGVRTILAQATMLYWLFYHAYRFVAVSSHGMVLFVIILALRNHGRHCFVNYHPPTLGAFVCHLYPREISGELVDDFDTVYACGNSQTLLERGFSGTIRPVRFTVVAWLAGAAI